MVKYGIVWHQYNLVASHKNLIFSRFKMADQKDSVIFKVLGTIIIPTASLILIIINNATTNKLEKDTLQLTREIETLKINQQESVIKKDLEFKYIELFYQEIVSRDSK